MLFIYPLFLLGLCVKSTKCFLHFVHFKDELLYYYSKLFFREVTYFLFIYFHLLVPSSVTIFCLFFFFFFWMDGTVFYLPRCLAWVSSSGVSAGSWMEAGLGVEMWPLGYFTQINIPWCLTLFVSPAVQTKHSCHRTPGFSPGSLLSCYQP